MKLYFLYVETSLPFMQTARKQDRESIQQIRGRLNKLCKVHLLSLPSFELLCFTEYAGFKNVCSVLEI